jgi:hypothetical protein
MDEVDEPDASTSRTAGMPTALINLGMSSNIQQLDAVCANTWQIMAVCGRLVTLSRNWICILLELPVVMTLIF